MSHGAQGEVGQGKTSQGSLAIVLGDVAQPVSVQSESVRVDVKATLQSEALSSIHNIAIVNHWAGQGGGALSRQHWVECARERSAKD